MIWKILWPLVILILIILSAVIIYIANKMFKIAMHRDGEFNSEGLGGFEDQIDKASDICKSGREMFEATAPEDVYTDSFDGLRLHGYFHENKNSKKVVILVHGFRSYGLRDFSAVFPYYINNGYSILLIDQRAHGGSEGEYITYGVLERFDLRNWVEYINSRMKGECSILLHGVSMGATTTLMASVLDLSDNVRAIIADSGFTSPHDIFEKMMAQQYHIGTFPILNIVNLLSQTRANFGFDDASTLDAMENNEIPVMFVHGEQDSFVPISMSMANYEICKADKDLLTVKEADHCCSYLIDREKCEEKINAFLGNYFG